MEKIVQVYFQEDRPGFGAFSIIENPYPSFGKLLEAVQDDEMIICTALRTVATGERGSRRIVDRSPVAFRGDEVQRVQIPTWTFIEDAA